MNSKIGIRYRWCPYCNKYYDANKNHMCKQKKRHYNHVHERYEKKKWNVTEPLRLKRWRNLRKKIIVADGGLCIRCLKKYGIHNYQDLTVHHIKPRIDYPQLLYDPNNLITLCRNCNDQLGEKQWHHNNTDLFGGYYGLDFEWSPKDRKYKNIHYVYFA